MSIVVFDPYPTSRDLERAQSVAWPLTQGGALFSLITRFMLIVDGSAM